MVNVITPAVDNTPPIFIVVMLALLIILTLILAFVEWQKQEMFLQNEIDEAVRKKVDDEIDTPVNIDPPRKNTTWYEDETAKRGDIGEVCRRGDSMVLYIHQGKKQYVQVIEFCSPLGMGRGCESALQNSRTGAWVSMDTPLFTPVKGKMKPVKRTGKIWTVTA